MSNHEFYDPCKNNRYESARGKRIAERIANELKHLRGRVSLPTGLSDEEVLRLYHELGKISIEAARSNLIYEIIFEENGIDSKKYQEFFKPVEQIVL